jgi:indole-3-glycerol phosphate synthase
MVLFIARVLGKKLLKSLVSLSSDLGLSPLVEVHSLHELDWAVESEAELIGINNRDLVTFHVDTEISKKLLPHIPDDRTKIVESGLKSSEEMEELEEMGADAFLVGETIVSAPFPGDILKKLLGSN